MKDAAHDEVHGVANITPDKHVRFQVSQSYADTATTTWSIHNVYHIVNWLEKQIYCIVSNKQMHFVPVHSNQWTEFQA